MNYASKRDESSWYILCLFLQYPPLSYRFPCHNLKHFIIREPDKGHRQADVPCKLAGYARFFRAKHGLYPIKQIDRPEDEVSHLFRAVFTLKVNHIAGLAVQTHFRRLLCLRFSFFSLLFGLKCNKKSGCACSTSTRICRSGSLNNTLHCHLASRTVAAYPPHTEYFHISRTAYSPAHSRSAGSASRQAGR